MIYREHFDSRQLSSAHLVSARSMEKRALHVAGEMCSALSVFYRYNFLYPYIASPLYGSRSTCYGDEIDVPSFLFNRTFFFLFFRAALDTHRHQSRAITREST